MIHHDKRRTMPKPKTLNVVSTITKPLLSEAEAHVFHLISLGHTTKEIANMRHCSNKTINAHKEHIKFKLHIGSATKLLATAVEMRMRKELCE